MESIQKAVGYIRVSTDTQDFERQREEIVQYAKRQNFTIIEIFEDKHTGTEYTERVGFQELLTCLNDNSDIKIAIFDEISRMGRDTAEQVVTYKMLSKKGVRIYTRGKGEFGLNKEDNLLFTVLSAIAEYERHTIIDRMTSGRNKAVIDGATQISNRPYGYDLILTEKKDRQVLKRQFVKINEEEANNIRKIYDIVNNGGTVNDCIRWLKNNNIKTTMGKPQWSNASVLRVLHNKMSYGKWIFHKYYKSDKAKSSLSKYPSDKHIEVNVPAIISKELFDSVQEKLTQNKELYNHKNQKDIYLLKGAKCSCGKAISAYFDNKTKRRIYRCHERNIEGVSVKTCKIKTINADFIEKVLLTELKKKIGNPKYFKEYKLDIIKNYQSPKKKIEENIIRLSKELEKEKEQIRSYYEKSVECSIDNNPKAKIFEEMADKKLKTINETMGTIKKLKSELDTISKRGIDYKILEDIKQGLEYISMQEVESLKESDQEKKMQFVRRYIKSIQINYLEENTENIRNKIKLLREKQVFKRGNEFIKSIYISCYDKNKHNLKAGALYCFGLEIIFINNFMININVPYYHNNNNLVKNYLENEEVNIINY